MTPLTSFFCGLGLLILFFCYFVTDDARKKRLFGSLLAILVTAFSAFFVFYTGNFPDSYSLRLQRTGESAGQPVDDSLRNQAVASLRESLKTDSKKDRFAITARQDLISISRQNLPAEEVDTAVANLEPLGLQASVTESEKPSTAILKGIDLQGGVSFTVRIDPSIDPETNEPRPVTEGARQQAVSILEKRLDPDGAKNLSPIPQGDDRVVIEMPGITAAEASQYEQIIQKVARLEFRMVKPGTGPVPADADTEPGWVVLPYQEERQATSGEALIVRNRSEITGDRVTKAFAYQDPQYGNTISLTFDGKGSDIWADVTSKNIGERFAVIIDGEIILAPSINSAITGGSSIIYGSFQLEEAQAYASMLENPLQNPLVIEEFSEISATYGAETISQGIKAGIAGLLITAVFMLIYYRIAGLIALFGLVINMVILFALLAIFEFALTMSGIAGIILTIGMAVDASVLIYERLKEELRAGKSVKAAIEAAYDRAFSAIFDANITTLITSLILFWVASGIVKGFAITLTMGIFASVFAALIISRVCFNWGTSTGIIKNLSFPNVVEPKRRDFLSKRRIAFVFSTALIVISVAAVAIKGKSAFGIDFRGGAVTELHLLDGQTITEQEVRDTLAPLEYTDAQGATQTVGQGIFYALQSGGAGNFIVIRSEFDAGGPIADKLVASFKDRIQTTTDPDTGETLASASSQRQGALIGTELAYRSVLAAIFSLIAILIYVSVRFEFSFALGAIVALFHDLIITIGIVVITGRELNLILVGAFLTILGYSINDTIVIFDRVREELRTKRGNVKDIMNLALSQTLSRTILTAVTTLFTVTTLYLFGGPVLADFSFAMIVGIIIGTYSTVFIASPIVLWWARSRKTNLRREVLDSESEKMDPTTA